MASLQASNQKARHTMLRMGGTSTRPYGAGRRGAPGDAAFLFGRNTKTRVNRLFTVHALIMLAVGLMSASFPEVLVYILHHNAEGFHARHEGGAARIAFVTMRVFGCFLLAQAYVLYVLRTVSDGTMRRAVVQSYFVAFLLTTIALARAQLTEDMPVRISNWLVISIFAVLTAAYAWYSFFERISVFELGR